MRIIRKFALIGLVTFVFVSCSEETTTPSYPPTITSFEVDKTEGYPEETITITANATSESDEALNYFFSSNKGVIKANEDAKSAELTLPSSDGEVVLTLDVKNSTDSVSDIKIVDVLPVKFYDRFKNGNQIVYESNTKTSYTNNILRLSRGSDTEKTYGYLIYRNGNMSQSTFKGFKTRLSTNGINSDSNFGILRVFFSLDPNKEVGKQLIALYYYISPRETEGSVNFYTKAIMKDMETDEISYKYITPNTGSKIIPAINIEGEMFDLEVKYNDLANMSASINGVELFNSTVLSNLLISESCTSSNIIADYGMYVYNNMELNVDYIYLPE